eukprot:807762-Prymnesium_polylepis.1
MSGASPSGASRRRRAGCMRARGSCDHAVCASRRPVATWHGALSLRAARKTTAKTRGLRLWARTRRASRRRGGAGSTGSAASATRARNDSGASSRPDAGGATRTRSRAPMSSMLGRYSRAKPTCCHSPAGSKCGSLSHVHRHSRTSQCCVSINGARGTPTSGTDGSARCETSAGSQSTWMS